MEDGAPVHQARTTKQWHTNHGVTLFPGWPGNLSDLNPIKNLWSQMKDMKRDERATSAAGLKKIAEKLWRIILNYFKKLYESIP